MIIRTPRWSFATLTLLVALGAMFACSDTAQAQVSKQKPVAIITVNSINHLLEDINFIGSLGGQPRLADSVRPIVGMLQGLDNDQPIGLVVQADEVSPSGALCIPVKDFEMLLGGMKMFGLTHVEGPDGLTQITVQGQQPLFAKQVGGWAFLSMMPQMLEQAPANPAALFGALTKDYDIGVRVHVQNIPEAFKQMALSQLQAGMEAGMKKLDSESDEQYEARKEMTKVQVEQLKQAAQDLDQLTFGIAVDGEQQRTFIDVVYTAVVGSKLAEQIALNSDPKTDFAGFVQPDAAMMMSFASKVGESDIAQMEQMFSAMQKQAETAIEDEADEATPEEREIMKSAISDFMSALKATLQAGKMDGGAVLNVSPSSLSLVAGGFVADPSKVESGIKKLTELAKKEDSKFPGVNWNASSHGDVQFHTMNIPIPEGDDEDEKNARKLFGDTIDVAIGIGRETAFFAMGRDCLESIKGIIETSAASPQKSVPPMEMSFALSQIMAAVEGFVDEDDRAPIEMINNMLGNEANGRDHVRIVVQPIPNGARTRIEAEEGVLRAIGMGVMAAQMEKMEAAGAGADGGF